MNDIHIFVEQTLPLLKESRDGLGTSSNKKDRRYYVPAVGRQKFARRTDQELKAIFDRYLAMGLYEAFIITAVSMFEAMLVDVMRMVLVAYPKMITTRTPEVPNCTSVPINVLLDAPSHEEAIEEVIRTHVAGIMYAKPKAYIAYFAELTGARKADPAFDDYVEIKATRDLLVHNTAKINETYISKAGKKARGGSGQAIVADRTYFNKVIATLKRLSGIIERDSQRKFPAKGR